MGKIAKCTYIEREKREGVREKKREGERRRGREKMWQLPPMNVAICLPQMWQFAFHKCGNMYSIIERISLEKANLAWQFALLLPL